MSWLEMTPQKGPWWTCLLYHVGLTTVLRPPVRVLSPVVRY